jgi:hypothetical protein
MSGAFCGRVEVAWLADDPRQMKLLAPVTFRDWQGYSWRAYSGAIVNGASVPRFFWRLWPPCVGRYRRATVLHDVACEDRTRPSPDVHRMFYEAMRTDGTNLVTAWLMWLAVRVFGPRFPGRTSSPPDCRKAPAGLSAQER